jgi:UDP-N-acetylglucosamine--N-acetylmuramyl-(pentapeptide) pyrophosphoryl-undecaprenol N-acetylglucosamine transferase
MPGLYAKGDMIIARSGAMTVSEASAVGMPAIFVPYPHAADRHQHHNAEVLQTCGAAIVVDQATVDVTALANLVEKSLFDAKRLEGMSRAAKKAMPQNSGARITDVLRPWLEAAA